MDRLMDDLEEDTLLLGEGRPVEALGDAPLFVAVWPDVKPVMEGCAPRRGRSLKLFAAAEEVGKWACTLWRRRRKISYE